MKLFIILVIASTTLASVEHTLPKSIINDEALNIELLRCDYDDNYYLYKITYNATSPQNLTLYASGQNATISDQALNYATHEIGGSRITQFNYIQTFNSLPVTKFGVISVENATGALLFRKTYDCDNAKSPAVFVEKLDITDTRIKIDLINHYYKAESVSVQYQMKNFFGYDERYVEKRNHFELFYDNQANCNASLILYICPKGTIVINARCHEFYADVPCFYDRVSDAISNDFVMQTHIKQFKEAKGIAKDEDLDLYRDMYNCGVTNTVLGNEEKNSVVFGKPEPYNSDERKSYMVPIIIAIFVVIVAIGGVAKDMRSRGLGAN